MAEPGGRGGGSGRAATIRDVARAAGVSTVTVSRVANSPALVRAPTRERVLEVMRQLGYVPHAAARSMRTNKSRTVGFLVPDLTNHPNAAVAKAAEGVLAAAGYVMLLTSSDHDAAREAGFVGVLRERRVDGMMLYVSDERDAALARALAALDVPLLVLDRDLELAADGVFSEHRGAMRQAVAYLVELGHRRLALLHPELHVRPVRERRRAFVEAATEAGLGEDAIAVASDDPRLPQGVEQALALLAREPRPTGVIVEGNRLLRDVLHAARSRGLQIPRDLSLIAIDASETAVVASPEITRIERDFAAIGRIAADLLLRRLQGRLDGPPQRITLESRVILGGSCAAPAHRVGS